MAEPRQDRLVTVDGPAGSGKSTLGRRLASALRLPFIDTGLFYRAISVAADHLRLGDADPGAVSALASRVRIDVETDADSPPAVWVDGRLLRDTELHDPARSPLLAAVSRNPGVRAALLPAQRAPAAGGAVAAGRDCGTVVFPGARVKLYLEADERLRTARRASQLQTRGAPVDVALLDADVRARDVSDASRADAPLVRAPDSVAIDTGSMGIDEMVDTALAVCRQRGLIPPTDS